jgi:hypothetical protein
LALHSALSGNASPGGPLDHHGFLGFPEDAIGGADACPEVGRVSASVQQSVQLHEGHHSPMTVWLMNLVSTLTTQKPSHEAGVVADTPEPKGRGIASWHGAIIATACAERLALRPHLAPL